MLVVCRQREHASAAGLLLCSRGRRPCKPIKVLTQPRIPILTAGCVRADLLAGYRPPRVAVLAGRQMPCGSLGTCGQTKLTCQPTRATPIPCLVLVVLPQGLQAEVLSQPHP